MPTARNRIARIGIETMPAEKARREHAALRVDRHHVHRRELLAGLHQADLGGQRGAGAAGEQQRGHDRPELAHQRQVDDQAERLGGAVGDQRVVPLQRQHEADGQPRSDDDHQRKIADRVDLVDHEVRAGAAPPGRRAAGRRRRSRDGRGCAAPRARADAEPRDQADSAQRLRRRRAQAPTPKSSASGGAG